VLALAIDGAGTVYWAESAAVWRATADGRISRYAAAAHPGALAVDRAGNLFIATATEVVKVTPAGTRSLVTTGRAQALAVDGDDTLYVGEACTVHRFGTGPAGPLTGTCAASLFAAAPGVVYYTDARTGTIARIGPAAPPAPGPSASAPAPAPSSAAAPAAPTGGGIGPAAALLAGVALLAAACGSLAHRRRAH